MKYVAEKVPFGDLCKVCEKIGLKQGKENKQKILKNFINCWREFHAELHKDDPANDDSFFPAMRLLLPQFEKDRGAYGIKEVTLAKLYIDILCLSKDSEHATRLLNYRSPANAKGEVGDFASIAYVILKNRCPEKGTLSIQEVNDCLDSIATNNANKNKDAVKKSLLRLLHNTSAIEQKWLIRMIMKSLKFGLSEQTVLALFHPDAKDLFDVSSSLAKVCSMLHDPNVRLNEIEITLFSPFRPMLADTANPNKMEKQLEKANFVVETKYDGERMQLHMDGGKYVYFSRNGNDFTASFGGSATEGSFTKHVASCFKPHVKNCILDGEMVGYNVDAKCIGSKGENFDVKSLKDGEGDYQPCYCVFDILLRNDTVLTNKPLGERVSYLKDLFTPIEGRIQLALRDDINTKQEVVEKLNQAIDNREEGIVIKDVDSIYKPNTRKGGWYKIKPDYVDNLVDEVDLLIVGGYFGEGRRRGLISHFLLGVAEPPANPGELPTAFHSFCRVGSGYTLKELYDLCLKLNAHWHPYDRRQPPPNIIIGSGHKERPDLWIEPKNSHIVQVKAAEINKSSKFNTGCTLRFPRVEKVRYDKEWHECLTLTELEEIQNNAAGKLASHYVDDEDSEPSPKKKRVAVRSQKPIVVAPHFKGIDPESVEKVGNLFAGKEMCVVNGPPDCSKQDLEKMIVENGGTIVQNPGKNTYCVLAHKLVIHVKNIMKSEEYNVVKPDWLLRCVKDLKLLKWVPADMLSSDRTTSQSFSREYDKFGDHYTQHLSGVDGLLTIFKEVEKQNDYELLGNDDIAELELEYFPNTSQIGLFRSCKAYFDRYDPVNDVSRPVPLSPLELTELKFRFHGGVVRSTLNRETTHVVMDASDTLRRRELLDINKLQSRKFRLVTDAWVTESILKGTLLPEKHFEPA